MAHTKYPQMTLTARPRHRPNVVPRIFAAIGTASGDARVSIPRSERTALVFRFSGNGTFCHSSDAPIVTFARARLTRGDSMGGGGREHARAEPTDPTDLETVEKHTSALVGTILASILWVLSFGDRDDASEEA